MKERSLVRVLAGVGAIALCATLLSAAAFLLVVKPSDLNGWVESSTGDADVEFVAGPATPPSGAGSLEFRVGSTSFFSAAGARLRLGQGWDGMKLSTVGIITYSTYVQSWRHCRRFGFFGHRRRAVYVALDIDHDEDGVVDDVIYYQPAFNGRIRCNTWQEWNATVGLWYSLNDPVFAAPGRPLAHYVLEHPQAAIVHDASGSGISLAAGHGSRKWRHFLGNAYDFSIGSNEIFCSCQEDPADSSCLPEPACLAGPFGTYDFETD